MSKSVGKIESKKSLQNYTNEIPAKRSVEDEAKRKELIKRLDGLYQKAWQMLTEASGEDFDRLYEQLENTLTTEAKNALWERNSLRIQSALHNYLMNYKHTPSVNELAALTNLSRMTVNKHIKNLKTSPVLAEEIEKHKMIAGNILSKLYSLAVQGNIKAARLYAEILFRDDQQNPFIMNVKRQQNNFIFGREQGQISQPQPLQPTIQQRAIVYSIGYGNRKTNDFLMLLRKYRIGLLIDIRTKPVSRFNPDYNRKRLELLMQEDGIGYKYMGDTLGGMPRDQALYNKGEVSYPLVWNSADFQQGIRELMSLIEEPQIICLMCCELDPATCHRKNMVGDYLKNVFGLPVNHIDKVGGIKSELF